MANSKVLIIEDDSTIAASLAAVARKQGYAADIFSDPNEALAALDSNYYKMVFIDCLLPQMPGVDLAKQIRMTFDPAILPIVMMSGVFVDKQMAKEIVTEVGALAFFFKPFDAKDIMRFLKKEDAEVFEGEDEISIMMLPDRVAHDPKSLSTELVRFKKVHGYELPLILGTLVRHFFTGVMELLAVDGQATTINFIEGRVANVEDGDRNSFLGQLLVSGGWILPEDLEEALLNLPQGPFGEGLAKKNFISPHSVDIVMTQQATIRMSHLIRDERFILSFKFIDVNKVHPLVPREDFYLALNECIGSKIPNTWLASQLGRMQNHKLKLTADFDPAKEEYQVPLMASIKSSLPQFSDVADFAALQKRFETQINGFHRAFYYLLCLRGVVFTERIVLVSEEERTVRLQKLWSQIENMSLTEVFIFMGGQEGLSVAEVEKVHERYIKNYLGNAPENAFNEALNINYQAVNKKILEAVALAKDPQKWQQYNNERARDKVSKRTQAQLKIDEAKKHLSMRHYSNGMVLIQAALQMDPSLSSAALLLVWARIGMLQQSKTKSKDIQEIILLMGRVPREEKITAEGNLVEGLLAKAQGQIATARQHFKAALTLDKNLLDARRELNSLPAEKEEINLLQADLGKVIGSLFKKS